MTNFQIFLDSASDINEDTIKKLEIAGVAPLTFNIDGAEYAGCTKESGLSIDGFYDMLKNGSVAITSQVNASSFEEYFTPVLEKGEDILYIGFSSALSGTVQSANIAKEELSEKYPDRKIIVLDTLCASAGLMILADKAKTMKDEGMDIEKVAKAIEDMKQDVHHLIAVDDLMFLERGGRLSKAAAVAGSLLNLKPIIEITREGTLEPTEKVRGMKKTLRVLVEKLKKSKSKLKGEKVYIGHAASIDTAKELRSMIEEENLDCEVIIFNLGPIIGAHLGPGTVVLVYKGIER